MFIEFLNHVLFSTLVCYPFTFTLIVAAKPLRLMGSFLERRVKAELGTPNCDAKTSLRQIIIWKTFLQIP